MKVLTIKRKIILGIVAIYCFAALWDGHWVASIVLAGVAYWYANKPYNPNLMKASSARHAADDDSDVDDSKPTPSGFNQISSSGSAIWTDYDEHMHDIK